MNCKKDILLDAPCPELLCGLCADILEDPMQVYCSEDHMFCSSCLADYKDSSCPSCMEPLDKSSFQLSKFVKRQISRLRVCCVHKSLGCAWEGVLEDSHSHSQSCQYQSIPCPNSHNGCPNYIKSSDIYQHKQQCLYELMSCPNGSTQCQAFLRKDSALHDSTCSSFQCPFAHEGCSFIGTRADVNQHCENYCGKLHQRIKHLEQQYDQMKQQLHPQHDMNTMENIISNATNDTLIPSIPAKNTPTPLDSSMDEMTLFHQMFDNGLASITTESNGTNINTSSVMNYNNGSISNTGMMDLSACIHNVSLPTSSTDQHCLAEDSLDTAESRIVMAATAPKRSSNGKIIRYSRNKQLAHDALRMARQRTPSGSNLTTEAILDALHEDGKSGDGDVNMFSSSPPTPSISTCPSSSSSSSSSSSVSFQAPATTTIHAPYTSSHHQQPLISAASPSSSSSSSPLPTLESKIVSSSDNNGGGDPMNNTTYSFRNLDDVTKFLEELPPIVETTPSEHKSGPTPTNIKVNNDRSGKHNETDGEGSIKQPKRPTHSSNNSQQATTIASSSSNGLVKDPNKPASKPPTRPMYVLASTLLSKRSQGN